VEGHVSQGQTSAHLTTEIPFVFSRRLTLLNSCLSLLLCEHPLFSLPLQAMHFLAAVRKTRVLILLEPCASLSFVIKEIVWPICVSVLLLTTLYYVYLVRLNFFYFRNLVQTLDYVELVIISRTLLQKQNNVILRLY
jgi:hypothetical protein